MTGIGWGMASTFGRTTPTARVTTRVNSVIIPSGAARKITNPAVVGAIIDLGYCLNLLDETSSPWQVAKPMALCHLRTETWMAPPTGLCDTGIVL